MPTEGERGEEEREERERERGREREGKRERVREGEREKERWGEKTHLLTPPPFFFSMICTNETTYHKQQIVYINLECFELVLQGHSSSFRASRMTLTPFVRV